jgi:hypothetical protein
MVENIKTHLIVDQVGGRVLNQDVLGANFKLVVLLSKTVLIMNRHEVTRFQVLASEY